VKLGMVGLGRMGAGMTERLRRSGHEVVGYDARPDVTEVPSLDALAEALPPSRVVWCMLPPGEPTQETVTALAGILDEGDLVVDGGNSYFRDSMQHGLLLSEHGVLFVDAGVSGGIWGLEEGFCLMVGGIPEAIAMVEPALSALAPEDGWAHVGPPGSGHFVKMVHNGIEYGLLQAYAEGFEIMKASKEFAGLDLHAVAELWRHGSVVRSWLLDLAERALRDDPILEHVRGYVEDSGEGRWTLLEAIEEDVPAPVTALSLFARFNSRQDDAFAMKLIAALRNQFGGHAIKPE